MNPPSRPPDLFGQTVYRDAPGAIAFLRDAFAFEPVAVYPGPSGRILHAELRVGRGYVMLASLDERSPRQFLTPITGGAGRTGSTYVGTPDVEATYARAKGAGARIVRALMDTDHGSRDFSALDPEDGLWHFGTYRPTVEGDPYAAPADAYCTCRYEDARGAIGWLERAFGFTEQIVIGEDDFVAHAELRFGTSIFMVGSVRDDDYRMQTPRQLGDRRTHAVCGYVDDPDAHCARARAAGADIILEPAEMAYGPARIYVARDPEGYLWSFGTYRPGTPHLA